MKQNKSDVKIRRIQGCIGSLSWFLSYYNKNVKMWKCACVLYLFIVNCGSCDSSVGIMPGYGLDDRGSRVRFLVGAGNFSFHHHIQNISGAHPASYWMGTRGSFPGVKWLGCEADHSPPCSAEVKNAWSYTSTPQYVFMAWCLVKHKDNFTFYLFLSLIVILYPLSS
jgi:hypothetical protein